jgi:glycosyltransferase involved in cell wall biosynthesis
VTDVRLIEFLGHGGLAHYALQLTRGLRENGLDAKLVTAHNHEFRERASTDEAVELFRTWNQHASAPIGPPTGRIQRLRRRLGRAGVFLFEWLRLLGYLERERPTWVQFGEVLSPLELPFLLWLKARGFHLADVCHNVQPFDPNPASSLLRKGGVVRAAVYGAIYRTFDLVFVHSDWSRREFLRLYRARPERVAVIPHGNEALFRSESASVDAPRLRERLNVPPDAPVALFFGTLVKYKGIEDLVRAFPTVLQQVPDAHLVIAGYPMLDMEQLRRQIAAAGIQSHVSLWPQYVPMGDVPSLMALATVAVFPYRSIDQSGALQVAYTFGVPVVATAVGGLHEVVEHDASGLVVPPGDGAALAAAVADLLRDPTRAARLGARARVLSETRFSWREVGRLAAARLLAATRSNVGGQAAARPAL